MWFFSKMNELVRVNREAENLLSRIPIRDSTFFDEAFQFFMIFRKCHFWKFWKFLEKGGLRHLRRSLFGNGLGLKFGKNWYKMRIYGRNDTFYLQLYLFSPILRAPRGQLGFYIFQNYQNFQNVYISRIS